MLLRSSFNSEVMGSEDPEEHDEVEDICDVEGVVTASDSVVISKDDDTVVGDDVVEAVLVVDDVAALVGGTSLKYNNYICYL